jgi:hypothetical protein
MANEERETVSLIGSDKVEGTAVYGADDTQIGSIERVMIDKRSGKVSYAVLSFGGFLGIGDDHYPLPWNSLKYDTDLGGYPQFIHGAILWPLGGSCPTGPPRGIGMRLLDKLRITLAVSSAARSQPKCRCRHLQSW